MKVSKPAFENVEALPMKMTIHGMQLSAVAKHLKTESEAKRNVSNASSRTWKIINANKTNSLTNKLLGKYHPDEDHWYLAFLHSFRSIKTGSRQLGSLILKEALN